MKTLNFNIKIGYLLKFSILSLIIFSNYNSGFAETENFGAFNYAETRQIKTLDDDFQLGLDALNGGDFDKAILYFTKFLNKNPRSSDAYYNRAKAYLSQKKYDLAIVDLTTATEINPQFSNAYNNIGFAYFNQQKYDLSVFYYSKAVEVDPQSIIAYNNRGYAYEALGKNDLAKADFAKGKLLKEAADRKIETPNTPNNDSTKPVSEVDWTPVVEMNRNIFPSYFLATATQSVLESNVEGVIGDAQGMIGIHLVNPKANTKVRLVYEIDSIVKQQEFETTLKENGRFYQIYPKVVWNWDALKRYKKPSPANATFSLYLDGKLAGKETFVVRIRSINESVYAYSYLLDKDRWANTSWLFAAYVNEDHEWIDQILKDGLNTKLIDSFIGYQGKPEQVINQVFTIWYVLQKRGFKYSDITNSSGSGTTDKVFSQYVRLFDESINASQANCVDGSVLIASILKKIGIKVGLVLVPGHCFLVFDADGKGDWRGLETTMMGNVDLDAYPDADAKLKAAIQGFLNAMSSGNKTFAESLPKINEGNPQYKFVDIDKARKNGIFTISW